MDELPLLELFTRLREAGLPLGIEDYDSALQALQVGYGFPDRKALARLCQTLWVRSPDERRLFEYYFEQVIGSETVSQTEDAENNAIAAKTSKQHKTAWIRVYAGLIGILLIVGAGVTL